MERKTVALGNGLTLSYLERAGGSEPLVLLHGITDSAKTYEPLADRISERFKVYALDFRGHGESDKPDSLYDTDAYADDVRHFIREVVGGPVRCALICASSPSIMLCCSCMPLMRTGTSAVYDTVCSCANPPSSSLSS